MLIPPPFDETERAIYQVRLNAAVQAHHELLTGTAVRKTIDQNGESVEFSATNINALDAYIRALREALSPALARYNAPRPIGFLF